MQRTGVIVSDISTATEEFILSGNILKCRFHIWNVLMSCQIFYLSDIFSIINKTEFDSAQYSLDRFAILKLHFAEFWPQGWKKSVFCSAFPHQLSVTNLEVLQSQSCCMFEDLSVERDITCNNLCLIFLLKEFQKVIVKKGFSIMQCILVIL